MLHEEPEWFIAGGFVWQVRVFDDVQGHSSQEQLSTLQGHWVLP